MELSAFAEAVLFSADLDTKLHAPAHFTDDAPSSAISTPDAPGRPFGLCQVIGDDPGHHHFSLMFAGT